MDKPFKFGEVEEESASQLAKDQAYIQKLLQKDAQLSASWEALNKSFEPDSKNKKS